MHGFVPLLILSSLAIGCHSTPDGGACSSAIGYPDTAACRACMAASCGAEAQGCYGSTWQAGHLGGACATYTACLCSCAVQDATCAIRCAPQASTDCLGCSAPLAACIEDHCYGTCTQVAVDGGIPD